MKKLIFFILFISTVTSMVSCTSSTYEEISAPVTNPTYTANVEPVIKANCTGCHSGGQSPNLTTYEYVKNATQNGDLICRIDQTQACGRVMPPSGPMSKQTIDMIILWQTQGYAN
ncbi:MAG: hypothetical protein GZ087_06845 [Flavobacterium sp.]|nr:hypothetical protein [Flavobacterium sp.]